MTPNTPAPGGSDAHQPVQHTVRVRVRHYELDPVGHVNNAVYLHYVEEAAIEHARAMGFDEARWREIGGVWVGLDGRPRRLPPEVLASLPRPRADEAVGDSSLRSERRPA